MANMEKNATGRGANRRLGQPAKKDIEALQEIRARDMIARDPATDKAYQNKQDIEQQQRQSDETNRSVARQDEAIQKLHENPEGMRAVQDTAANMAFIQEQMQSSADVSELEAKLKNHNWQYSGDNEMSHASNMRYAAKEMMEAKQDNDPEKMERAVRELLRSGLGHARINDSEAIVRKVMQKTLSDPSLISDALNNLTKKG